MATVGSTMQALKKRKQEIEDAARDEVRAQSVAPKAENFKRFSDQTQEQMQEQIRRDQAVLDEASRKKPKAWWQVW